MSHEAGVNEDERPRGFRRPRRWAAIGVFLLVGVCAGGVLLGRGGERAELDDAARAAMTNERFVHLRDGVTQYEWQGPENGKKVVLVHGYASPYFIWDRTIPALAAAGFRVLRFDLYGRGLSERLKGDYACEVFERQLLDLLDALGVKEPVDLVGLSMGGAIVTRFTDLHPERVRRLVLIGTAGVNQLPASAKFLTTPHVGEWVMKAFGDFFVMRVLPKEVTEDLPGLSTANEVYAAQLHYRGYKHALLSTLRNGPLTGQEDAFARVGRQEHRAGLLIWGTRDTVVPYKVHQRVKDLIPWLDFRPIEGARHCANYEQPEPVNRILVEFLAA